jgi:hypothetical protein
MIRDTQEPELLRLKPSQLTTAQKWWLGLLAALVVRDLLPKDPQKRRELVADFDRRAKLGGVDVDPATDDW